MDEIEQQKIELEKDERNSTNNKNGNDSLNIILSVTDRIYQFFQYKLLPGEQPDELKLPKWVKVTKQRFDVIKKEVQNAKKKKICKLDQIVVGLLPLANQINYFKT